MTTAQPQTPSTDVSPAAAAPPRRAEIRLPRGSRSTLVQKVALAVQIPASLALCAYAATLPHTLHLALAVLLGCLLVLGVAFWSHLLARAGAGDPKPAHRPPHFSPHTLIGVALLFLGAATAAAYYLGAQTPVAVLGYDWSFSPITFPVEPLLIMGWAVLSIVGGVTLGRRTLL